MKEWEKYFREVLGRIDEKMIWGERERRSKEERDVAREKLGEC